MAKKSKRGEKLDLQEFLGSHAKALPSAPAARDPNAPEPERRPRRDRDAPLGGFEEPAGSGGWRRGGGAGPEGGDSFDQGPRGGRREREELPPSLADEDTEWRKSRPPRGGEDDLRGSRRPPSAADEATEWRRREPLASGPAEGRRPPPPPSIADEASEWRRKQPIRPAEEPSTSAPPVSIADEASEWRRKDPIRAEPAPTPAVSLSDSDPMWRKAQPVRAAAEEAPSAPRPSASEDWRANKPPVVERVERPKSSNSAASRDSDNWRAAAKLKKISGISQQQGQGSGKRKQRETIPVDTEVLTPFGKGVLVEERASDRMRIVKLQFGATAYLRPDDVIPSFPEELQTSYGKAKFISYRFSDSMCEVELEFGGHAFIRLSEVLSANNVKPSGKSARPESFGNKRSNAGTAKDAPPRAGNRRFGDQERDKERENAFAKGEKGDDKETPSGPSKSEQFAAFSSTNRSRASEGGDREEGAGRPPRSELFAAFSRDKKTTEEQPPRGISGPPRVSREEKDKLFAVFNSGPRTRGDRPEGEPGAPPPRASAQGPRGDLFAAFDRNRDANPRFSREEQQPRVAFPAFGRNRDQQGPPRVGSANSSEGASYQGGMERFNASRPPRVGDFGNDSVPRVATASPAQDEFPSLSGSRASNQESNAPVIPKALPKGTKWGDEDEVEEVSSKTAKATPPPKKVTTMEIALVGLRKSVKEYMIGEDRASAVTALGALAVEDEKELQAVIVSSLANEAFAGTKPKKLVASLYLDLVAKNIVSVEGIAEGLTRTLEASGGDNEKLAVLRDLLKAVEEKNPSLVEVKLREAGAKLRGSGESAEGGAASNVEVLAKEVYASGSVDKLKETGFAKLPGAGLALLDIVLKDAKLDDAACAWVTKNAKILGAVLYNAPIKEQLKALEAIQVAFNGINFPRTNAGSIFEKVFTQLYNLDVFPDTAFIEWKDDLSLNAPGRDKAIIQTTNFFVNLEAEEYDEDEDDDE